MELSVRAPGRRFGVLLLLLLLLGGAMTADGGARVLTRPDQRAILLLVSQSGKLRNYGTGVVVGPGIILTAEHVLATSVEVLLSPTPIAGAPACRTRYESLAVIKAPLPEDAPYYRVSFRAPGVGARVTAAGYPLRRWRVVTGRITEIIRSANLSGRAVSSPMIVFTPALDYGASGAPLLDERGQVLGITVASNRQSNYSIALPTATGLGLCRRFVP